MDVQDYLEEERRRIAGLLEEMVRIPTVNPPGENYLEMVELLQRQCERLGMETEIHQVPDRQVRGAVGATDFPRYDLIARWRVGAGSCVHFNAHYDVVPAEGAWRSGEPFQGRVRGERVYGRGAEDMKGSIAALLAAVEAVQQSGRDPAFDVECSFTADEETGGALGAGYVVGEGLVEADYAVVCEGAGGAQVGCGHNGVLWFEVEIEGKAAHASRPEEGINAFEQMAVLVQRLQDFKRGLGESSLHYRDYDGKERGPTLNIGGLFGGGSGAKVNTVPARAFFSIDRRVVPGENLERAERELRRFIELTAREEGIRIEIRSLLRIEPCVVDPCEPLLRSFAHSVQKVRRRAPVFCSTSGFTDLHFFVREGGIPGLGYGVRGANAHGRDEWVAIRELVQTARVYAEFMCRGVEV